MPPQCGPFQPAKCLHFCSTLFPPHRLLSDQDGPKPKPNPLVCGTRAFYISLRVTPSLVMVVMVRSRALSPRREPVRCLSFLPLLKAAHMTGSPCVQYTLLHSTTTQRKNNSKFPGGTKLGFINDWIQLGNIWILSIN